MSIAAPLSLGGTETTREVLRAHGTAIVLTLGKAVWFSEIAKPLQAVLQDGLQTPVPVLMEKRPEDFQFTPADQRVYVMLALDSWANASHLLPPRYIAYQFEQLQAKQADPMLVTELARYKALLARALCVWENAAHLLRMHRDAGIRVLHVPLAYHPSMNFLTAQCERGQHCRWANAPARDIDVVWIGNTAQRRKAIIDAWRREVLEPPVLKHVLGANNVWNNDDPRLGNVTRVKAEALQRARLAFNVHVHEPPLSSLEVVRIVYFIANRVHVLSEPSGDTGTDAVYAPHVTFCAHDQMVSRARQLLAEPETLERKTDEALRWAQANPYAAFVQAALSEPLPLPPAPAAVCPAAAARVAPPLKLTPSPP